MNIYIYIYKFLNSLLESNLAPLYTRLNYLLKRVNSGLPVF